MYCIECGDKCKTTLMYNGFVPEDYYWDKGLKEPKDLLSKCCEAEVVEKICGICERYEARCWVFECGKCIHGKGEQDMFVFAEGKHV